MRESKVEAHLVKRVTETGGTIRKMQYVERKGCPDRHCGWKRTRRAAWVELKGDGGELSPHQVREIQRLLDMGERVEVLSSIEEVDAFVEDMIS